MHVNNTPRFILLIALLLSASIFAVQAGSASLNNNINHRVLLYGAWDQIVSFVDRVFGISSTTTPFTPSISTISSSITTIKPTTTTISSTITTVKTTTTDYTTTLKPTTTASTTTIPNTLNTVFYEYGLPDGAIFKISYDNGGTKSVEEYNNSTSIGSSIIVFTNNLGGAYQFNVPNYTTNSGGICTNYKPNPASGLLQAGSVQYIVFNPVPCGNTNKLETFFDEWGLPNGGTFVVTYNNSTKGILEYNSNGSILGNGVLTYNETAGTYSFTIGNNTYNSTKPNCVKYVPSPRTGTLRAGDVENIGFSAVNCKTVYKSLFDEWGLPNGGQFTVTYNNITQTAIEYNPSGSIVGSNVTIFNNTYGTYAFTVSNYTIGAGTSSCIKYVPSVQKGVLTTGYVENIGFSQVSCKTVYKSLFDEWGLPNGGTFGVTYNNVTKNATEYFPSGSIVGSNVIVFNNTYGTYTFTVSNYTIGSGTSSSCIRYVPSIKKGVLTTGYVENIGFSPVNCKTIYKSLFDEYGLPNDSTFTVTYNNVTKSTVEYNPIGSIVGSNILIFNNSYGTYTFTVPNYTINSSTSCIKYVPSVQKGVLTTGYVENIGFSKVSCKTVYKSLFDEWGLPNGGTFGVTYNNVTQGVAEYNPIGSIVGSNVIIFNNTVRGTYQFTVYNYTVYNGTSSCTKYVPSVQKGVLSTGYAENIGFSEVNCNNASYTTPFSEWGLPNKGIFKMSYDADGSKSTVEYLGSGGTTGLGGSNIIVFSNRELGNYTYNVSNYTTINTIGGNSTCTNYIPNPTTGHRVAGTGGGAIVFTPQKCKNAYYLNASANSSIFNFALYPPTGYYLSGSSVPINASEYVVICSSIVGRSCSNYTSVWQFYGWIGFGSGSYTGGSSYKTITIDNNLTEIAQYYRNSSVNGSVALRKKAVFIK
jgi:hypothetical protein